MKIVTEMDGWLWHSLVLSATGWTLYMVLLSLYRVTFHPLAKFPGPKIAGISYCYEFWFDVVLGGRYTREIQKLHGLYGPIIRINPDELHCNDPAFIDVIYASGNQKRDKSEHFISGFLNLSLSGFGTLDHSHHRLRRTAINKFFSRSQIVKLENFIHSNVDKLCDKLLAYRGRGPFQARAAFSCLTTDIITDYCFGSSTGFLDQDDWDLNYGDSIGFFFMVSNIFRHMPWLRYPLEWIPLSAVKLYSRKMWAFMSFTKVETPERIKKVQSSLLKSSTESRPTVFSALITSNLPMDEKTTERLIDEGNAMTIGGTETTAAMLSFVTYQLLANPAIYQELRRELLSNVPNPNDLPKWAVLEKLPYLSAVIHEGLRLSHGVSQRLPRIATDQDLAYEGRWIPPQAAIAADVKHIIPRRSAIGMSAFIMHMDETIFPNAASYIPERWLEESGQMSRHLDRYLLSFSKGSRQCIGMQLAYCELFVCVAALALRVLPHVELYETDRLDVDYDHDELIGKPRRGSPGVRILVK